MVAFQVSRYPEPGFYTEMELGRESTLFRLIELSEEPLLAGELPALTGRITIESAPGYGICIEDDLVSLMHNLCTKAAANLARGRSASVAYSSHYGNLMMQPLNDFVFITGDFTLYTHENTREMFKEKAFVMPAEPLLESLTECCERYHSFLKKWRSLISTSLAC